MYYDLESLFNNCIYTHIPCVSILILQRLVQKYTSDASTSIQLLLKRNARQTIKLPAKEKKRKNHAKSQKEDEEEERKKRARTQIQYTLVYITYTIPG